MGNNRERQQDFWHIQQEEEGLKMPFYENLGEGFVRLWHKLVRGTKGVCKSVHLSRVIRQEEQKQDDLFRQIGEYYYQTHGKEAEGQLKVWCDAIWNNKMMVIQYQSQKRLIQGITYCPVCKREVPEHSRYCNHCGARVPIQPQLQSAGTAPFVSKICPHCGTAVLEIHTFCPNCGGRLPEMTGIPEQDERNMSMEELSSRVTAEMASRMKAEEQENAAAKAVKRAAENINVQKNGSGIGASLKKFVKSKAAAVRAKDEEERAAEENVFAEEEQAVETELSELKIKEAAGQGVIEQELKELDMPENTEAMQDLETEDSVPALEDLEEQERKEKEEEEEEEQKGQKEQEEQKEQIVQEEQIEQEKQEEASQEKRVCRECGSVLEEGYNFCSKCGLKI